MGAGQSKDSEKFLEELPCKDWKVVQKEDPTAIVPLCYWIKRYGFNGKLSTTNLKELREKIKTRCKGKETRMKKEGCEQIQVWMRIAGRREEGERRARQDREEKERQEKESEGKAKESMEKTVMFHKNEDNEYSGAGPYQVLRQQLAQFPQTPPRASASPTAPQTEPEEENDYFPRLPHPLASPPSYYSTPQPKSSLLMDGMKLFDGGKPFTRSQGDTGDWSRKVGGVLSPPPRWSDGPEGGDVLPLIELPNPRAGTAGQQPTVTVFRTWTQEDI